MDIINNYEIIHYNKYDTDKYTGKYIYGKCTIYYMNGKIHRNPECDLPAIIYSYGLQCWYVNGQLHRDNDKPAIMSSDGSQEWWVNGQRHRDNDLPAIIDADGSREWWVNGQQHRDNDQPAIIERNGRLMEYILVNISVKFDNYFLLNLTLFN